MNSIITTPSLISRWFACRGRANSRGIGVAEYCDVVTGKVAVPDLSRNLIVFRDSQGGYGDLTLAAYAYEEAKRRGLGQEISIE